MLQTPPKKKNTNEHIHLSLTRWLAANLAGMIHQNKHPIAFGLFRKFGDDIVIVILRVHNALRVVVVSQLIGSLPPGLNVELALGKEEEIQNFVTVERVSFSCLRRPVASVSRSHQPSGKRGCKKKRLVGVEQIY